MASSPRRLTLGSGSPRRASLLESLGIGFVIETAEIDEEALVDSVDPDPVATVARIAEAKFRAVAERSLAGGLVLTADTLVACDGAILGKPASSGQLITMLGRMSGRPVTIATGFCIGERAEVPSADVVTTIVRLRELDRGEIAAYVATGTGMDKAGGLALQGAAKPFIDTTEGCWTNVMGLPLCAVARQLGPLLLNCGTYDCETLCGSP